MISNSKDFDVFSELIKQNSFVVLMDQLIKPPDIGFVLKSLGHNISKQSIAYQKRVFTIVVGCLLEMLHLTPAIEFYVANLSDSIAFYYSHRGYLREDLHDIKCWLDFSQRA